LRQAYDYWQDQPGSCLERQPVQEQASTHVRHPSSQTSAPFHALTISTGRFIKGEAMNSSGLIGRTAPVHRESIRSSTHDVALASMPFGRSLSSDQRSGSRIIPTRRTTQSCFTRRWSKTLWRRIYRLPASRAIALASRLKAEKALTPLHREESTVLAVKLLIIVSSHRVLIQARSASAARFQWGKRQPFPHDRKAARQPLKGTVSVYQCI
jgi:hypothetical protein